MTPNRSLLTASEVAEELSVDPETVRRWARQRKLTSITLPGGSKRFRAAEVEQLLAAGTQAAA
jgi:excisionase family DNA binding protein